MGNGPPDQNGYQVWRPKENRNTLICGVFFFAYESETRCQGSAQWAAASKSLKILVSICPAQFIDSLACGAIEISVAQGRYCTPLVFMRQVS